MGSLELDYPILSDPKKKAAKAFGVLRPFGFSGRVTVYVNKEGKIAFIDKKVKARDDGKTVAKKLAELKVAKKSDAKKSDATPKDEKDSPE